jgi:hypothetical protein
MCVAYEGVVIFGSHRISSNYEVGSVSPWFETFTGGDVLSLICLFRRCCISNEVGRGSPWFESFAGGDVLRLIRLCRQAEVRGWGSENFGLRVQLRWTQFLILCFIFFLIFVGFAADLTGVAKFPSGRGVGIV